MDIYFWLFAIALGIPLWWFGFIATKRMRLQKNAMREEQAKKNLAEQARKQAENAVGEGSPEAETSKPQESR